MEFLTYAVVAQMERERNVAEAARTTKLAQKQLRVESEAHKKSWRVMEERERAIRETEKRVGTMVKEVGAQSRRGGTKNVRPICASNMYDSSLLIQELASRDQRGNLLNFKINQKSLYAEIVIISLYSPHHSSTRASAGYKRIMIAMTR